MSRHDGRTNACESYTLQLRRAISALFPHQGIRLLPQDSKERWTPRYLAIAAVLMACLGGELLIDRFHAARCALVRMYLTRRRPGESYQGFIGALKRVGDALLHDLAAHLRLQVRRIAPDRWLIDGWLVFGCDGSRFDKTRTCANKRAFGRGGRHKAGPQQYLTTLFHVGSGLPWCWQAGNANASERDHLRQMLEQLPPGALLLLDAGYSGHDLLQKIIQSGRSFIVRVGANVELLEGLGWDQQRQTDGTVALWPKRAQKRGQPPLRLRLIRVIDARGRQMCLLSSVLDRGRLSDAAARRMYKRRWRIEVLFRSIKQTMQLRKARSWTPQASVQELHWSMIGVWVLGLMALKEQAPHGARQSPAAWSAARTLRVIRRVIHGSMRRRPSLALLLQRAVHEGYRRRGSKKAIDWPHKKREKPPGNPRCRRATRAECRAVLRLKAA